jgi:hypothetical protein
MTNPMMPIATAVYNAFFIAPPLRYNIASRISLHLKAYIKYGNQTFYLALDI